MPARALPRKAGAQVASQKLQGRPRACGRDGRDARRPHCAAERARRRSTVSPQPPRSSAPRAASIALGLRACHPVAWHLHYVLSLVGERTVLLDSVAGIGPRSDPRRGPARTCCSPSASRPIRARPSRPRATRIAHGVPIVAVTDSEVSPLAQLAAETIFVADRQPVLLPHHGAGLRGGGDPRRAGRRAQRRPRRSTRCGAPTSSSRRSTFTGHRKNGRTA